MKIIDLASEPASMEDILHLAEHQSLLVRTPDGRVFVVAEVEAGESEDDFAQELALTRHNKALRAVLADRSIEPAAYTLDHVRQKLGLHSSSE